MNEDQCNVALRLVGSIMGKIHSNTKGDNKVHFERKSLELIFCIHVRCGIGCMTMLVDMESCINTVRVEFGPTSSHSEREAQDEAVSNDWGLVSNTETCQRQPTIWTVPRCVPNETPNGMYQSTDYRISSLFTHAGLQMRQYIRA